MKLGCIILFAAFILINFHASDAVDCPVGTKLPISGELKDKCTSCVIYGCSKDDKLIRGGYGCPENFFQDCAAFDDDVELIKSKNYSDLQYRSFKKVFYLSGCGEEIDGQKCLEEKNGKFIDKFGNTTDDVCIEAGSKCSVYKNGASKMSGILGIGLMMFAWIF